MVGRDIGPYRILQKIAQGSMCAVYKGVHTGLEQEVAIKFLLSEYFDDKSFRERFVKEAKIQARLSHPNVVKTLNFIENDHTVMMVMEYVNGETLDVLLRKVGVLPPQRALAILESMLEALDFMHSKGIVHRDIKPANIMVSYEGFVKVMDFGIAKMLGDNSRTKTGVRIGTLWYMSPEQIRGEQATVHSDIYSVGVTLYQMVTGMVPFDGDTEFEIMKGHIERNPVAPWKINKELDREIGNVILRAMDKNPKNRYQSVKELLVEIQNAIKPQEQTKIVAHVPKIHRLTPLWFQKRSAPERRVLSTAAVLVAAAAMVFTFYLVTNKTSETDAREDIKVHAAPAIKQPSVIVREPVPSMAVETGAAVVPSATVETAPVDVPKKTEVARRSVSGANQSKVSGSASRRNKYASNRDRKVSSSGVRQQTASVGDKNRSASPGSLSSAKDQKKTAEGAWTIRK
jgi:serine/threonine protein kinase